MAHWVMQMDELMNSYLTFQSNRGYDGMASEVAPAAQPKRPPSVITIDIIDLFCMSGISCVHISKFVLVCKTVLLPIAQMETYSNETLLWNGYLGCSPLTPTVAIAI